MIQLNARPASKDDTVALLLECHERIRRYSAMAVQLARSTDEEPAIVQDAAQRVHRYFSVALPLHVIDEDESIRPRLEPVAPPPVVSALEKMSQQHQHIDAMLERLLHAWDEVRQNPARLSEKLDWLPSATKSFQAVMGEHLSLEETVLFPFMRQAWDPATHERVVQEMRARRQPSAGSPPR